MDKDMQSKILASLKEPYQVNLVAGAALDKAGIFAHLNDPDSHLDARLFQL